MAYRFNIADIDRNTDDQEPDLFEDYPLDDEDEYGEEPDCFFCNATGEGCTPDTKCSYCNGRGTIKKRKY